MAAKAKIAPEFGRWLKARRESRPRKWRSHEHVAREMRRILGPAGYKVPASQIVKFEKGKVPDGPQLYALSVALKIPLPVVNERLMAALGAPLPSAEAAAITDPFNSHGPVGVQHGGSAVPTALVRELVDFFSRLSVDAERLAGRLNEAGTLSGDSHSSEHRSDASAHADAAHLGGHAVGDDRSDAHK